ncbi:MAG: hypothetical protein QM757_46875 [Paludibaculum sp.]
MNSAAGREWPLQTSYLSSTALKAEVSPDQIRDAGTAYVTITDTTDTTFSRKLAVTITSSGPSVTSLLPNTARAGEPGVQLIVKRAELRFRRRRALGYNQPPHGLW